MKIIATAHIKEDKTEAKIEVWDADYFGKGSGMPVELRLELKNRGYEDTNDNITGLRLTIKASLAKTEMEWLKAKNIPLTPGHMYK